jgi:periplasmic divalent cation tolerance protein
MPEEKYVLIMTTCVNNIEASKIIDLLCRKNLAACVQMHEVKSFYKWENMTKTSDEFLIYIKTQEKLYEKIEQLIKQENHHYKIPEIIKIPIKGGLNEYLDWIHEVTEEKEPDKNKDSKQNSSSFSSGHKWYR